MLVNCLAGRFHRLAIEAAPSIYLLFLKIIIGTFGVITIERLEMIMVHSLHLFPLLKSLLAATRDYDNL